MQQKTLFEIAGRAPKEPNLAWWVGISVGDLMETGVTPGALRIWAAIKSFADTRTGCCFPSQRTIARRAGVKDVRTVRRHIARLVALGMLEVEPAGRQRSHTYRVIERFQTAARTLAQAARSAARACRPAAWGKRAPQPARESAPLTTPGIQSHEGAPEWLRKWVAGGLVGSPSPA